MEKWYKIGELAKLAEISVRSLQHYHQIGLLEPSSTSEAGYRLYNQRDLAILQQILIFKSCGVPLQKIKPLLVYQTDDQIVLLEQQKLMLTAQALKLSQQISTLEKTVNKLKGGHMKDEDLYKGFGDQAENIRRQAIEKYGNQVIDVESKLKTSGNVDAQIAKGEAIAQKMSECLALAVDDEKVQNLAGQQLEWLQGFYEVKKERFEGLAQLYISDESFSQYYDKYHKGTAQALHNAMMLFSKNHKW